MRACNLQGAGGRARSPTPWGGISQETPYLAYGPELDASYREAPQRASSWKLKLLVYQHEWYVPHKGWDNGPHTRDTGRAGAKSQAVREASERAQLPYKYTIEFLYGKMRANGP